jgi:ABC-type uncharacterized transport system ATPase subunit
MTKRIALISEGRIVEYGDLDEIRRRHSPVAVYLETPRGLEDLPHDMGSIAVDGSGYHIELTDRTPQDLLRCLEEHEGRAVSRATGSTSWTP